ncbi:TIGR00730 family Rossman fold protein [Acidithiobacillus thiooxidans]|uniref:LOG family protein n=1 Tax=Acidithiobacillus thiooxidans TaxID=930 RepID=UPI001C07AE8D|nr:TIGR00730 family Rossman fold protein [Acidithiobacillus thiooxidans]MBU2749653.1 TIGR00730 family Rossman fold protein [Acidithiobacillus thiooxidans]
MDVKKIKSAAVFCGSNFGDTEKFREETKTLGNLLYQYDIKLVYGGTTKGLMGVIADAVLNSGGEVHGIITNYLQSIDQAHPHLDQLEVCESLSVRKRRMIELADVFIILPGGIGTMEEFLEVWTMNQLAEIDKPIGLLNIEGYFDVFLEFINKMVASKFLPQSHKSLLIVNDDPLQLIKNIRNYEKQVVINKWI